MAGLDARARFTHVMRGWAADEAKGIERMLSQDTKGWSDRLIAHLEAMAERRWVFVLEQCAKHGIRLGK